jgi:hypothetical protein
MLRSFCFVFCMQGDSIKKEPSTGKLPHDYAIVAQMKKRAPKNSREVLTVWDFFKKFNMF